MAGFTKLEKAYELLREYNGENPHMLRLKSDIFTWKNSDELSDFNIDYILRNHDKEPIIMNKMITLTDWLGEKKKEQWKTDFVPKKVKVISYLGDTEKYYCFFLQYRQSKDPVVSFLPKNGIVTNLFTKNPEDISVDFDRYDTLSTSKDPNRRLREHQKYSVKFLLAKKKAILALDMGLGKSTVLSVAAIEGNFDSVLIICPASLKTNWKKELMWYVPERDISIVDGFLDKKKDELEAYLGYAVGKSGKKKDELLKEAKEKGKWEDNRFVIVNFDILDEFSKVSWARSEKGLAEMAQKYPLFNYIYRRKSLIIIDEAHKLSNSTSNRYKLINNLIKLANPDSVYLSTGTPVTNMPSNLYCLLKLLDAPICADYNFYVERYCGAEKIYAKGERAKWTDKFLEIRHKSAWYELSNKEKKECAEYVERHARKITVNNDPINLDELKSLISSYYLRMEKSDVTDLPKKHIIEKRYDLSSVQKTEYDRLWEEYEAEKLNEDPDKEINKELLEGSLYRGYLADQMVEKTIKLTDKCLKKGEKVVIACCYDNELYALRDYYGDKCVIYNGKCSLKQKDAAIEKFRNDENVMVFIGNIIASGTGITLTNSRVLIFNSYDYVYANNSQMEDRIHRIGQDRECYVFYQMFNDTHCEHMWDIVLKKRYVSDTLITSD
jgi:SWI/SNF-related matrix-associated actin-dependent regulator 1 of chromatin subfamily A